MRRGKILHNIYKYLNKKLRIVDVWLSNALLVHKQNFTDLNQ